MEERRIECRVFAKFRLNRQTRAEKVEEGTQHLNFEPTVVMALMTDSTSTVMKWLQNDNFLIAFLVVIHIVFLKKKGATFSTDQLKNHGIPHQWLHNRLKILSLHRQVKMVWNSTPSHQPNWSDHHSLEVFSCRNQLTRPCLMENHFRIQPRHPPACIVIHRVSELQISTNMIVFTLCSILFFIPPTMFWFNYLLDNMLSDDETASYTSPPHPWNQREPTSLRCRCRSIFWQACQRLVVGISARPEFLADTAPYMTLV